MTELPPHLQERIQRLTEVNEEDDFQLPKVLAILETLKTLNLRIFARHGHALSLLQARIEGNEIVGPIEALKELTPILEQVLTFNVEQTEAQR